MLSALAALLAVSQPVPPAYRPELGRTAWLVATVQQSEFCPAGNVRLDLRTGRYEFTAGVRRPTCLTPRLERRVRTGTLSAGQLAPIRAAFLRVLAEGLENSACRNNEPVEEIIVNNGGTPIMVLTTGAFTAAAPQMLHCWTDAANALHDRLDNTFTSIAPRFP